MPTHKPIVPMFQAERPHGEVIEGFHWLESSGCHYICLKNEPQTPHVIKPETIKLSFDSGQTWRTMDEVQEALSLKENLLQLVNQKIEIMNKNMYRRRIGIGAVINHFSEIKRRITGV
jgi:hypothetical protein